MAKVSIITPVYDSKESDIKRTTDSLNKQTNKDFEWIIIEDGLEQLGLPLWAKLVTGWENYGPSVARNIGFQISTGDIITYVDMGDELSPERVQHIIDIFSNFNVEILFDGYHISQNDKNIFYNPTLNTNKNYMYLTSDGITYGYGLKGLIQIRNVSVPLGVSHTRKSFVEAGGFQRGIVCGEDGILWRRMIDKLDDDKIMSTDFNAGTYYVSQTGQSRTQRRFDMGGFAFQGDHPDGSNGQYLDENWFKTYNSKDLFDASEKV